MEPLEDLDDARLVRMTLSGRVETFGVLYDRHFETIHRYLLRRVAGRVQDAEDLAQQVFTQALERLEGYRAEAPFRAWLFGIARHAFLDWTARHVAVDLADETVTADGPPIDEAVAHRQDRASLVSRLAECMARLPAEKRRLIELIAIEGRNQKDVARILGISHDACRARYTRVRQEIIESIGMQLDPGGRSA